MDPYVIASPGSEAAVRDAVDRLLAEHPERASAIMSPLAPDDMFPPRPCEAECRVCGTLTRMTREHLPPKASGNRGDARQITFQGLIARGELADVEPDGRIYQGGVTGHMLCRSCNTFTGNRWSREYGDWARGAIEMIQGLPASVADLAKQSETHSLTDVRIVGVRPGRLIRQVITMMLCVSGSAQLGASHPALRTLALGGPAQQLPDGMSVFMCPCVGPRARYIGGRWGAAGFDQGTKAWRFVLEVAVPPLGFQLYLDGDARPWATGVDITHFTDVDVDSELIVEIDSLQLGFTYSPYPGDYRSIGQLRPHASTSGLAGTDG